MNPDYKPTKMFIKGCDHNMWSNHEEESTN